MCSWLDILSQEVSENGYEESSRLSGSGLRLGCDVITGKRFYQSFRLDRRAVLKFEVIDCVHQLVRKMEIMKASFPIDHRHFEG